MANEEDEVDFSSLVCLQVLSLNEGRGQMLADGTVSMAIVVLMADVMRTRGYPTGVRGRDE